MKIAVITGASSGLGCEFINEVISQVSKVSELDEIWLVARREQRLLELKEKYDGVCAEKGLKTIIRPVAADITNRSFFEDLTAMYKEHDADVRMLINNAGCGVLGNLDEMPYEGQINMVELNNVALTGITSVTLPFMSKGSNIINVCSIASFAPNPRMTVYCSTKAYVLSFSKSLRFELRKKGINVLAVCPGPMSTEFLSVAGIQKGASKTFDTLPRTEPSMAARGAVKAVLKGKGIYTPRLFFKFYRVLAKLLPHSIVMHMSKT
ncbi:MAG: SDR family NAD(P)-dependent oxidoreductase [Clostridia bacterium]|nr:SDR family NAD(P)-dependent oxidoreductase [Clostridia bacterium]